MTTTPLARPARAFETARIEVGVVPPTSDYVGVVREATRAADATFVRLEVQSPADIVDRIIVCDLTQSPSIGKLGPNVIAISTRLDLECYDVVSPEQVRFRLKRAIRNLVERERLRERVQQELEAVEILNAIGHALSAQTEQGALLDTVLAHACRVLRADGGSIYLVEADHVVFSCSKNDTIPFRYKRRELPKDESSMAGYVACRGESLNIRDAYEVDPSAPYRPNFTFDRETGYRTRSVLLVPMNDRDGEVLGVLALINRKQNAGVVLSSFDPPVVGEFTEQHERVARSIASQAAVAIQNYRFYREIRSLFDGFVEAAVTAIEARDPSTGGHSKRVADLTVALARAVHESNEKPFRDTRFSDRDLRELHYAAMLHDFGKVGVKEHVLLKAEKLYPREMDRVEARFRIAAIQAELESLQQSTQGNLTERLSQLKQDLGTVRKLNRPGDAPTPRETSELERIGERWNLTDVGERVLQPYEVRRLCIPRGTLSAEERREIQEHVTHTHSFLNKIQWTRDLRRVPELAWAHHEKLDGSGYPRGLKGNEIPIGSQLMAITDIFDALTAVDRPYRNSVTPERAVLILREEADLGAIHADAVALFEAKRLWQGIVRA
jgi:HD-GYP domain-containing protein (c-di-GMP phosphodiesterase class II)